MYLPKKLKEVVDTMIKEAKKHQRLSLLYRLEDSTPVWNITLGYPPPDLAEEHWEEYWKGSYQASHPSKVKSIKEDPILVLKECGFIHVLEDAKEDTLGRLMLLPPAFDEIAELPADE
jgi:hypothetical protein